MKIACVGDNCIDFYDETGMACPGGNPVNVAVYARRLGAETAYLGAVGTDRFGDMLMERLKAERVDISHVQRLEGPSALCHVTMREGDRVLGDYDEGVMECFALRKEDLAYLSGFDLVITGLWGRTEKYLEQIRASGTLIAFDGADRPFDPAGLTALPHTDLAFFSDDSMDDEALREKISSAASLGPRIVVATRGAKGSLAFDGTAFYDCPPAPCTVVDTMGAGDSYIAGFIKTWLEGKSIAECMKTGALTAASRAMRRSSCSRSTTRTRSTWPTD